MDTVQRVPVRPAAALQTEAPRHRLQRLLRPASVCVVGASERPGSVGRAVLSNLLAAGFGGALTAVNPRRRSVLGVACQRRISALPSAPELAVLAVPAAAVAASLDELAALGTRDALVLAGDPDPAGRDRLAEQASRLGLRIVGPCGFGLAAPALGLNATVSRSRLSAGSLAIVAQSSAVCAALVDYADGSGIGLSTVVATGAAIDVDVADVLDFLGFDAATRCIAVHLEGVRDARRLLGALRAAARSKPVVVLRAGQACDPDDRDDIDDADAGTDAPLTHSDALACADDVFSSALRRCGAVAVEGFADLFGAVEWLETGRRVRGDRLAIVANGAGLGVLARDACRRNQVRVAAGSPLNLGADATPSQIATAIATAAGAGDPAGRADAVLGVFHPSRVADSTEIAEALATAPAQASPIMVAMVGEADARRGRDRLNADGHAVFATPESAVRAFAILAEYHRSQRQLLEVPTPLRDVPPFDAETVAITIDDAIAAGRDTLDETRSKQLLAACGVPVPRTLVARTIEEAARLADRIGYPVVLKVASPDVPHKSDVGGVRLDVRDRVELRGAAAGIQQRLRAQLPQARFDGFTVQPMIRRGDATELLVGISRDPVFGPVLRFGAGGLSAEVVADTAVALPPLNAELARELIGRTRVRRLLAGWRQHRAVDLDALVAVLLAVSTLACRFPAIRSLDINPLLAGPDGALALDARIVLDPANPKRDRRYGHLAIHPYPSDAETVVTLPGDEGQRPRILLRPIRPEDAVAEREFFEGLSAQTRHWRFLYPIRDLSPEMIARFTQVDYDRDMALVAIPLDDSAPSMPIVGVARYVRESDARRAEFAIVVADAWQGRGLARALMSHLIVLADAAGLDALIGQVHSQNLRMLAFVRRFGFRVEMAADDPTLRIASLHLPGDQGPGSSMPPVR